MLNPFVRLSPLAYLDYYSDPLSYPGLSSTLFLTPIELSQNLSQDKVVSGPFRYLFKQYSTESKVVPQSRELEYIIGISVLKLHTTSSRILSAPSTLLTYND